MRKLILGLAIVTVLSGATCARGYVIAIGAKYDFGNDLYQFATSSSNTNPFASGSSISNLLPTIYPSGHLLLGFDNSLLDIGVGIAAVSGGAVIPISLGGLTRYIDAGLFKVNGGGEVIFYLMPAGYTGTYIAVNSTIVELEFPLPILPLTIYAGGGIRMPMVFKGSDFSFTIGWNVEAGARFYLMK
jgi:hypothetical protein